MEELVRQKGNRTDFIQRHPELPTSTVEVQVGEGGEPHYTIVHPVAWDDIQISPELIQLVQSAKVFVYSSLALRDERSRDTLFSLLPYARLKVCDINLREGHYSKETILRMLEQADILRMNEFELKKAAHWLNIPIDSFEDGVIKIADHYDYQAVVATLGGDGAMSYRNKTFFRQPVFKVQVKDTVGAGDAFLASYLSRMIAGDDEHTTLRYACAVGALTAAKDGGTPVIDPIEIDQMLRQS